MPVSIRYAVVGLVWVDSTGNVLLKDAKTTKLSDFTKGALTQEHRVFPNLTGPAAAPNSGGYPTIEAYLEAEAGDDHALAYMDQTKIVTQMIT